MKLAWGNKVSVLFCTQIIAIAKRFGWTAELASYLMACIAFESARTFSPDIRNAAGSGAVGLIQFMPNTAIGLGTTVENLELLSAESQLDYVEMYFLPYARRIKTLSDMYMAILLPKYIGALESTVLFSGGVSYRQNSGLDSDKDGKVTKREAASRIAAMLEEGMQPGNYREVNF